ncbi:P-type conjugative transfer protein TrbJ [Maridesulfovibrio ferrireducens]|uniref:P-type conjugative transfer protein TrbJ n=1 Tax=Maridesulfovibrio ferrireducens TaxID=246191 RepID=UPI001A205BCA|nr:P-type conjugative transfer protein TrbJ [Maridesulfovibrio ferrireducens]MBI9112337.1 P-type conjugative transfer protein TrbJ [Maridesulfovibrio ferrireducens]
MKKLTLTLILLISFFVSASPASAMVVTCTNCSDRFLQALERATSIEQLEGMWKTYAEEMMQTQQQIMMVKQNIERYVNMVKNTVRLPFSIKNTVMRDFKNLASLSKNLATTMGELDVMDGIYDSYYPSFSYAKELVGLPAGDINPKYYEYYSKWSKRVDKATKATFKVSGQQLKEISESDEFDSYIEDLLSTPEGRMQALEAANQLTGVQISEMRKLRALMATHIQNQAQVEQKKEKIEQVKDLNSKRFFENNLADQAKKILSEGN